MHVLYFCICTCSAQLSMFHMERRSRNMLIVVVVNYYYYYYYYYYYCIILLSLSLYYYYYYYYYYYFTCCGGHSITEMETVFIVITCDDDFLRDQDFTCCGDLAGRCSP